MDCLQKIRLSAEALLSLINDVRMPVRSLPGKDAGPVPIIAMSANAFSEDVEKSLAAGMNAHISMPFQIDELMALLGEL